ncbi:MAG: sugar isomerase domain-containing protein [Gammaproteobacteria bacterium]
MHIVGRYFTEVRTLFEKIAAETEAIDRAAEVLADAIQAEQPVWVFGTGTHSAMVAEDAFYRSGGLVPIRPILDPSILAGNGALHATTMERTPGLANSIFNAYGVQGPAVMILNNPYGINSLTIESADECKKRGVKLIALTSRDFCKSIPAGHPARHSSNRNLCDVADLVINTWMQPGDALLEVKGVPARVGPSSTLLMSFALNALVCRTVEVLVARGVEPEVWVGGNMVGGDAIAKRYLAKYAGQIKHLI